MESTSPIKEWVKKYSPLKSRNKPLPSAPDQDNQSRSPMRPTTANASPAKQRSSSKLRSLLKPKQSAVTTQLPTVPHQRAASAAIDTKDLGVEGQDHSTAHKIRSSPRTHDLYRLSQKVSDLEAQLTAARKELSTISSRSRRPSLSRRASLQHLGSSDIDQQAEQKVQTLNHDGRYDGLVENLLAQGSKSFGSVRQLTQQSSAGLSGPKAWDQYRAASDSGPQHGLPVGDKAAHEQSQHHKRKRSEIRHASWETIQSHLASAQEEQERQCAPEHRSKRSRSESTQYFKELPAPPASPTGVPKYQRQPIKSPHYPARPGDAEQPPGPQQTQQPQARRQPHHRRSRSRRSASEGGAGMPRPFTIQPVSSRDDPATTYDEAVAQLEAELAAASSSAATAAAPFQPRQAGSAQDDDEPLIDLDLALDLDLSSGPGAGTAEGEGNYTVLHLDSDDDDDDDDDCRDAARARALGASKGVKTRSPARRGGGGGMRSPSRLERVEEEYEWDDDIF